MSEPLPSETIEYERYVDELRRRNAELTAFADYVARQIRSIAPAPTGNSWQLEVLRRYSILSAVEPSLGAAAITVHIEGGLVQDVTGIPTGYEVRVEDYDHSDDTQPTWDVEKECHVTVYGGAGV